MNDVEKMASKPKPNIKVLDNELTILNKEENMRLDCTSLHYI